MQWSFVLISENLLSVDIRDMKIVINMNSLEIRKGGLK